MTNEEAAQYNQSQLGQAQQAPWPDAEPKKTASPVMTPTKAQAEDATFRIVGDAGQLFGALALAQGAFQPITKNRTVQVKSDKGNYTFDYATLDKVLEATVPALSANGLALLQPFYHGPNGLELRTILAHSSGARLEAVTELPKAASIQQAGSALTYLKRYQVQAILGVSSEEDDDGNAADGNQVQNMQPRDRTKPAPPPAPKRPAQSTAKPPAPAQDTAPAQEAPARQQAPQSAPQPKSEPPPAPTELLATADKTAEMKSRLVELKFKGTPAKELIQLITGKGHEVATNADLDQVISVLDSAIAHKWDADRLMLLVRETPDPATAIRAIEEESAAMGGAS